MWYKKLNNLTIPSGSRVKFTNLMKIFDNCIDIDVKYNLGHIKIHEALSKIENIILTLWFDDTSNPNGLLPPLNLFNLDNRLFVFAFSYNIARVTSGLFGLSYNG